MIQQENFLKVKEMDFELISRSPEETEHIGRLLGEKLKPGDILALQGTLAAGKTTLTKGIAVGLGIEEPVTSPTFTLISEYEGRLRLYHMDVYRLDTTEDFLSLGAEELLYGNGVSVLEWSEKIMDILPEDVIIIKLETGANGERRICFSNWNRGGFEGLTGNKQDQGE